MGHARKRKGSRDGGYDRILLALGILCTRLYFVNHIHGFSGGL